MTDQNQPMGPPPSYDEVQNMQGSGTSSYPAQPYGYPNQPSAPSMPTTQYPDPSGFKYDYSGVPQYPPQQNYGQTPYPMQPGGQYPYGAPQAAVYPPPPGGQAVYNPQGGVTIQPVNTNYVSAVQRRRKLIGIVFVFIAVTVFIYIFVRIMF